MAKYVVSSTVARLDDLLTHKAKFLSGVEGNVKRLQAELSWMQGFLNEDRIARDLLSEIKNAAYAAEDAVEAYVLKSASKRTGGATNVLKGVAGIYTDHEVASEIEAIAARISGFCMDVSNRRCFGMGVSSQGEGSSSLHERQRKQRLSYPHIVEDIVLGIEKNVEELVTCLVAEETNHHFVSICGVGGLGKTTLAKKIYHHSKVRCHFDHFAWLNLSQQYETRDAQREILFSLTSPTREQRDEILKLKDEELASKLSQVLLKNICLVVLDDVWSDDPCLRALFQYEATGSKILLTCRFSDADLSGIIYEPQFMNYEESWELLRRIARSGRDCADFNIDTRMEELGKKMVYYCGGLPFYITVLGGILATKYSSNEWQMVHDNIKSYSVYGEDSPYILNLSFEDLPMWLKPCFLYLSQFPEEYEINVNKLIRLWIAEGFVSPVTDTEEEEDMLEDVAECYLNELVLRRMILVGEKDESLRIKTCRLHNLMRDLCLSKAKNEFFLCNINFRHGDENVDDVFSPLSTPCRLAVHLHGQSRQFPLDYIDSPHFRSLLCFNDFSYERWRLWKPVFDNLKLLRVLDLEGADIGEGNLLKDVGELIHLRFLSLRHARVSKIPSSLGNLRFLQTLDLLIAEMIIHVPNVIWKMEQLRHFYLPEFCDANTKLRLDNLTNLRTLVNFPAQNCDVRDVFSMTNLRELTIHDAISIKNFTKISKSLGIRLKHLRALSLDNSYEEDDQEATKFKDLRSTSFGVSQFQVYEDISI